MPSGLDPFVEFEPLLPAGENGAVGGKPRHDVWEVARLGGLAKYCAW